MARQFQTSPDFKAAVLANGSAGTSGQVLTSAGAGSPPTWATPSDGGGTTTNASDLTTGTLANARLTAKVRAAVNYTLWSNFR